MRTPEPELPFTSRSGRGMPVTALAIDYGPRDEIAPHQHEVCQLIFSVRGVMVVSTDRKSVV